VLTLAYAAALAVSAAIQAPAPFPPVDAKVSSSSGFAQAICGADHCDETAVNEPVGTTGAPASKHAASRPQQICVFQPDPTFVPPLAMSPADAHEDEAGTWFRKVCTTAAEATKGKARDSTVGEIVWFPAAVPTAASLAQVAYKQLKPPQPMLVLSPPSSRPQLVGMPVWLSVPAGSWVPVTATASAGSASVTATATPVSVTWSMGDGSHVTCHGPGTPYPSDASAHPPLSSPTCGYTYLRPSDDAPGQTFPVTATTEWHAVWSGSEHASGSLPDLHTAAGTQVKVGEVQVLVTGVSS
jgi:hypothetical protein